MSVKKYQIGEKPVRRGRKFFGVVIATVLIFSTLVAFVLYAINK